MKCIGDCWQERSMVLTWIVWVTVDRCGRSMVSQRTTCTYGQKSWERWVMDAQTARTTLCDLLHACFVFYLMSGLINTWAGDSPTGRAYDWKGKWNRAQIISAHKGFFSQSQLPVQTLMVSVQPVCSCTHWHLCAHTTPTRWRPYHCLDTGKFCTYWYEWVVLLLKPLCLTRLKFPIRTVMHETILIVKSKLHASN